MGDSKSDSINLPKEIDEDPTSLGGQPTATAAMARYGFK